MENLGLNKSIWHGREVFVTGVSGLLGGWLVARLLEIGANVTCLMRDWVPQCEFVRTNNIGKVHIIRGDLRDRFTVERAIAECEATVVFHLAAQTIVQIANREPISTFESNIQGTWNVLEACRRVGSPKAIIVASSDKAYGVPETVPISESASLKGIYPYDVSKSCADLIATCYAETFALPVAITRCGNFFGGGDLNWNRIVPGTIRSIIFGQRPEIRSDGTFIRDYFYVEEGVQAYMVLAGKLLKQSDLRGQAFNFSSGMHMSVVELVSQILTLMQSSLEPLVLNKTNNEIRCQYLSIDKARDMLNWKPVFNLNTALERTINWYRSFFLYEQSKS